MSESKSRVNVHSILTIVPSFPVEPGKTHPLSVLDHAMDLHTVHVIFYYRYNRLDIRNSSDLGRLRTSLADLLSLYPPVTGRLMKNDCGNWEVKCNDAGVRVLKADVKCSLDEWLKSGGGDEEKDLTAWEEIPLQDPKFWSPYRIQMNDFAGGGLAIGLSCSHMNADPACTALLMKQWTELYHGANISQPPFYQPPPVRRPSPNLNTTSVKNYEVNSRLESPTVKLTSATFQFSGTAIKNSLAEIQRKCMKATPFHMLAALFWSSIINSDTPSDKQVCSLSIGVDFRKLIHAPDHQGFYGNAIHFSTVSTDLRKTEEGVLHYLTEIIHDHLSTMDEEEHRSVIDWLESKKGEDGKCAPAFRMYGSELTCVNMEHISAFDAVLEDKKPVHVSCHIGNVGGNGLILVLPSPEEGMGRTVMVTLPKYQTDKLCNDPAILGLEPTMLFA